MDSSYIQSYLYLGNWKGHLSLVPLYLYRSPGHRWQSERKEETGTDEWHAQYLWTL